MSTPLPDGDAEAGRELFNTRYSEVRFGDSCATCHRVDEESGPWAPTLRGVSDRAGEQVEGLGVKDYLRQAIIDPKSHQVEDWDLVMPTNYQEFLSADDIEDLIAYLLTL